METKSKISEWQLLAILLVSSLLSTITFMPFFDDLKRVSDYIISVLLGGVSIFVFSIPVFLIMKRGKGITQLSDSISKRLTLLVSVSYALFFLWFIFMTMIRMNLFVSAVVFPQKNIAFFMVLSVIAVCYAASHGIEALGRTATISIALFIISCVLILFSLRGRIEINNLSPVLYDGAIPVIKLVWRVIIRTVEPAALMIILPKVSGKPFRSYIIWIVLFTLISTIIFFCIMTTLGDAALLQLFPVNSMAVLSQFSVFERMDALLIGIWILSAFVKVSFLIYLIAQLISESFKRISTNRVIAILGIIISAVVLITSSSVSFLKITTSAIFRSVMFLLFVVVIPSVLLLVSKYRTGAKE